MSQKKTLKQRKKSRATKAQREFTAGGVVYRYTGDRLQLLMIQDAKGRWTIPKGHVEKGEKLEETAFREVVEETGLKELKVLDRLDRIHFFYRREGKLIFMTTYVFLMEAIGDTDSLTPGDSEGIVDAKWFDFNEAIELIEYKDTERLFRLGMSKLKSKGYNQVNDRS
jgi:8-oxo-dGTP diphosphatase